MKTLILAISLLFASSFLIAQNDGITVSEGTTIIVTVPVVSEGGSVLAALEDEAHFMKNGLQSQEGIIVNGQSTITFTNVTPGTYAVVLFHDKNGNKQMDFDMNGMPMEAYGVSNNVMSYGPPQWIDSKFEVGTEPIELEIRM